MPQCDICSAQGRFKCTKCGQACYCCAEHQREAWKEHKVDCKRFCAEAEAAKRAAQAAKEAAKPADTTKAFGAALAKAMKAQEAPTALIPAKGSAAITGTVAAAVAAAECKGDDGRLQRQGVLSACQSVPSSSSGASASLHDGRCLYVNLDRRPDRRKRMEALASPHAWLSSSLERISAVDGKELDWRRLVAERLISPEAAFEGQRAEREGLATMHEERPEDGPCHLTLGGCGCALSHLKAWRRLLDSSSRWALILEDDLVSISQDFDSELGVVLGRLPQDWLICYLGFHSPQGPEQRQLPPGAHAEGPYKMSEEGGWLAGLWCYVLSRAGAKLLLEQCTPLTCQVDCQAGIVAVEAGACYCLWPGEFLAYSKPTEVSRDTDIQTFPEEMMKK